MEPATLRLDRGIGWITLDNPPVNALSAAVCQGLASALAAAASDPAVKVIVLRAAGRTFSAGSDLREMGATAEGPELAALCARFAAEPKPVIAALNGPTLGGGLELALTARLRIATPEAQFGLPEVSFGLLPGAGGTQRLPRLIGAKAALGLMLSGLSVMAERAERMGLVDAVVEGDLDEAAEKLARAHIDGTAELPTAAERLVSPDADLWLGAVAEARARLGTVRLPAPGRIIDCVEAALLLPEDEGFDFERTAFAELLDTPEAAALRHAFLAEHRAAHQPELAGAMPRAIDHVGLIGTGSAAAGIAAALLSAGCRVMMIDADAEALAQGLALVAAHHDRAVARGRLTPAAREAEWDRIDGSIDLRELETADLLIVTAAGDADELRRMAPELDRVLKPGAVLAVHGTSGDLEAMIATSARAADLIGLHFAAPAETAKLLEIVVTDLTSPAVVATGFALARRLGKTAIRAGVSDGYVAQRLMVAYRRAMDGLVAAGASPYEIDRAMMAWGCARGPYQMADEAGLGAGPSALDARLVAAGRAGRSSGRGYYLYAEGARMGQEDAAVPALIAADRDARGIVARPVGLREIQRRALAAMANEGARCVEEWVALRPSDVDVAMLAAYGFPRWRGGPMMAADQAGLLGLRDDLRRFEADEGAAWTPAGLWDELIKNGQKFSDLNID
jgi:3-hydroxyacyl-CoA dehydrogenase